MTVKELYSKEQIISAVKEELIATNIALGIGDKLTGDDYRYIGAISLALGRLKKIPVQKDEPLDEHGRTFDEWAEDEFCR